MERTRSHRRDCRSKRTKTAPRASHPALRLAVNVVAPGDVILKIVPSLPNLEGGAAQVQPSSLGARMNLIIGLVVVMGCVLGGFAVHGGQLLALWQPSELLIIGGAATRRVDHRESDAA